ncbi:MAG: hypothetical protein WCJ49_07620 [Deltaproteobacteria bacterium]
MRKKIVYNDEPMQVGNIVKDFLPKPQELIFKKERVITLRLDDITATALKKTADQKGLGASTLVRMWVKEHLSQTI